MIRGRTILSSVVIRNFKAIHYSKSLKLTPLTVLIGNNGSGKSSVVEGLETIHKLVTCDLDAAMQMWHGIEHIQNKSRKKQYDQYTKVGKHAIEFTLKGYLRKKRFSATTRINVRGEANEVFFEHESFKSGGTTYERSDEEKKQRVSIISANKKNPTISFSPGISILGEVLKNYIDRWQFLKLAPSEMGNPKPQMRTRQGVDLAKDGSNIAEYLLDIRRQAPETLNGIIEAMQYVLPYVRDIQPRLTQEIERTTYLHLTEKNWKIPGWLLSTGTLRVLAMLALFRHPTPPPLIVIEEIENGLDPRTVHLVMEEIRQVIESGRSQVIFTTHSPYLLDLVQLDSVIFVEREDAGDPIFSRPANDAEKVKWGKTFGTGQLFTMGRLSRKTTE
jgi:predicted ATPase